MDNENINEVVEEAIEESVTEENLEFENNEAVEETIEEAVVEETQEVSYNLKEIPEYVDIKNRFSELETSYKQLQETVETLTSENENLTKFKQDIDKAKKEEMIKSFYMLSDEDKKDVIDNIDKYYLEEIEAKLSVICVRNKVSFNLDEKEEEEPITYNLNEVEEDTLVPAWVKAVMQNEKSKK